jgi:hypothetical protein
LPDDCHIAFGARKFEKSYRRLAHVQYAFFAGGCSKTKSRYGRIHLGYHANYSRNIFKILNEYNGFTNLYVTAVSSYISGYGTYDIHASNYYVEHVEKSYINPDHSGIDNYLFCQFIGDQYLILSYKKGDGRMWEIWKRVEGRNPFAQGKY